MRQHPGWPLLWLGAGAGVTLWVAALASQGRDGQLRRVQNTADSLATQLAECEKVMDGVAGPDSLFYRGDSDTSLFYEYYRGRP